MRWISPVVAIALVIVASSCSGQGTGIVPQDNPRIIDAQSAHVCWGLWQFIADPASQSLEAVTLHSGQGHLNVIVFLEPPPLIYLTLESVQFVPGGVIADIGLRHPFLALDEFTGFDVSGILISNGSYSDYSDGSIVHAGPGDTYLVNADGYTRWWNPSEFPHNSSAPISGYNDGLLGAPDSYADYNSTINGYKYYTESLAVDDPIGDADATSRGIFRAGQKNVRRFNISLGDALIFNYAVDACWVPPTGAPPYDVPGDFPPEANRSEPWRITVAEIENTLWYNGTSGGGNLALEVHVWDWYGIEDDTLYSSVNGIADMSGISPVLLDTDLGHAAFEVEYQDVPVAADSPLFVLIAAQSGDTGFGGHVPGEPDAAYFVHVAAIGQNQPPVALAEALTSTNIEPGGTVQFDATSSYDPDGSIVQYLWDFNDDGTYGDAHTGPDDTPTATFNDEGMFEVDLRVVDDGGLDDYLDETIVVEVDTFEGCTVPGDIYGYRDDAAIPYNEGLEKAMLSDGYFIAQRKWDIINPYNRLSLYKAYYEYEWDDCVVYNPVEDNFCWKQQNWVDLPSVDGNIQDMDAWMAGTGDVLSDDIFALFLDNAASQIVLYNNLSDTITPPTQMDTINVGYPVDCFDFAQNGDLWVLDTTGAMHRYVKSSSYNEATADAFDLPSGVTGNVFDFAIMYCTSNFYLFTDNTAGGTIYRLSPSGSLIGYQENALLVGTTNHGTLGDQGDIEIDHSILYGESANMERCRILVGGGQNSTADYMMLARYGDDLTFLSTWEISNAYPSMGNGIGTIHFDPRNHYLWTGGDPFGDPLSSIWMNSWWPIPSDW